jgi:hypothetical protein
MKMGTTLSPCPYDAATRRALQSANLRRPAILRYASRAAVFPISEVVRLPIYSGPSGSIPGRRDVPVADNAWIALRVPRSLGLLYFILAPPSKITMDRGEGRVLHVRGTRGSTLLIRVEDVVLRLYGHMASVSAI